MLNKGDLKEAAMHTLGLIIVFSVLLLAIAGFVLSLFALLGLLESANWLSHWIGVSPIISFFVCSILLLVLIQYSLNSKFYQREKLVRLLFPAGSITEKHAEFIDKDLQMRNGKFFGPTFHPYFTRDELAQIHSIRLGLINDLDTLNTIYMDSLSRKPRYRINWFNRRDW